MGKTLAAALRWFGIMPIGLIGILAAYQNIHRESFDTPEFGVKYNSAIANYVVPVRLAYKLNYDSSNAEYRVVADRWIAEFMSGRLKSVPRVHITDSAREGVKEEICDAKSRIAVAMLKAVREERNSGQMETASKDLYRFFVIEQIFASSEVATLVSSIRSENLELKRNADLLRYWTPEMLTEFTKSMDVSISRHNLVQLVETETALIGQAAKSEGRRNRITAIRQQAIQILYDFDSPENLRPVIRESPIDAATVLTLARQCEGMLNAREELLKSTLAASNLVAQADDAVTSRNR